MKSLKRIGCLILSLVMLFGTAAPGLTAQPLLILQVSAVEGDDATPPQESNETVKVSFTGENCTVLDAEDNTISGGIEVAGGTALIFRVRPDEGYKVVSVEADGTVLTAAADGYFSCQPATDMAVAIACTEKTAPVFSACAMPEGVAKEKYFQIELVSSDAQIALTAYSKNEFQTLEALQTAISPVAGAETSLEPTAFLIDTNTVVLENGTYYLYLVDAENRMAVLSVEVTDIDTTAPAVPVVTRLEDSWVKETAYDITFDDPEDITKVLVVPMDSTPYEIEADENGNFSFTVSSNGTYTIQAFDAAGNAAVCSIEDTQIDTAGPVISDPVRQDSGWITETTYTFTVTDEGCGIESVTVTQREDIIDLTETDGVYQFTVDHNAAFTITATDNMGNVASISVEETQIDTTNPEILSVERESSDWAYAADYRIAASDAPSGVSSVIVLLNGEDEVEVTRDGDNYLFTAEQNGEYQITVTDQAGNTAATTVTEEYLDRTAPAISQITRIEDSWSTSATYTFQVTDPASGIASVKVLMGEKEIALTVEDATYRFDITENGEYTVVAVDNAGSQTSISITEDMIDLTAPVISNIAPQSEWDAEKNTITITASDDVELASVSVADADGNDLEVTSTGADTFQTVVTSNGEYSATAIDRLGNSVTVSFTVEHIDTTQPSTPELTSSGNQEWVNTDVVLTASSQDQQSGVVAYWYSTSEEAFSKDTWQKMETENGLGTTKLTSDQDLVYYVIAEDQVGRLSEPAEIRVRIDKTAPETLSLHYLKTSESGYLRDVAGVHIYNNQFGFHMEAADSASGVAAYAYQIVTAAGSTDWEKFDGDASGLDKIIELAKNTDASVYIRAYDIVGNCTEAYTNLVDGKAERFIVEITPATDDQCAPAPQVDARTASGSYSGSWTNEDVIIQLSSSEDVSVNEYYQWRMVPADPALAASEWQTVPVVDGVHQLTVASDANATYYFQAVTYLGIHSEEAIASMKVQKTLPKCAIVAPEAATGTGGWFTKLPTYTVTLPEQYAYGAPVQYVIRYSHNGETFDDIAYDGSNAPSVDKEGDWTVQVISVDEGGNSNPSEAAVFRIDITAPDSLNVLLDGVSILNVADGSTQNGTVVTSDKIALSDFTVFKNRAVTVTASADGGNSGLSAIYYQFVSSNEAFAKTGEWTLLGESGTQISPENQAHLFFKAVDNAGNITYFTGQSVIVDSTAGNINIAPTGENLSGHGFYNGDTTVNISVEDPATGTVFAGLDKITYQVLSNGVVTQSGTLYDGPGAGSDRIQEWSGQVRLNAAQNNSNNVVLEVTVTDNAGNTKTAASGTLKFDVTKPEVTGSFDTNQPVAEVNGMSYFTGSRRLTVTANDRNFVAAESRIYVTDKDTGKTVGYEWKADGAAYTATLDITEDGHYTVTASISDAAGNKTDYIVFDNNSVATGAFVLDNTKPVVTVSYDNNDSNNNSIYFNTPRTATITVVERNFDPEKVTNVIRVTNFAGEDTKLNLGEWTSNGNTHTATINFTTDGTYHISVTTEDILGNQALATKYNGTAAQEWVLDQQISDPEITGIHSNSAYGAEVVPEVTALDPNLENITVQLLRTTYGVIEADVTEELVPDDIQIADITGGKSIGLDIFPLDEDMDGIYTLVVTSTDKAGNTASSSMTFSINRNGSTFAYEKNVLDIMGKTMKILPNDLVIQEINPTKLVPGSCVIQITKDGTPISNPVFTVNPIANGEEEVGANGWYEYLYTISKDNFTEDGTYTVVISTKDAAGNLPENTGEDMAIRFSIDTTAPELTSVVGLEKAIVKAESLNVAFSAIDNIGLSSISVYVDGEQVSRWTELDGYTCNETFTISEGMNRHVRIVIVDKAGNILDTDMEGFNPGFIWQDVTVSSNAFLRFYANKPLFYGTIISGAVVIVGFLSYVLWKHKRKNEEDDEI